MASLPRLELPRGHRLLLLDDRERDARIVGIRAVPQVMQRHAPGAIRHAHGYAPLALAAGARVSAATGVVGAATGAAATGAAAAPGGSSGASPIEMSGKSSACTVVSPWLTSN